MWFFVCNLSALIHSIDTASFSFKVSASQTRWPNLQRDECFHTEQLDKISQSQLWLPAVSHTEKSLLLSLLAGLLSFRLCYLPTLFLSWKPIHCSLICCDNLQLVCYSESSAVFINCKICVFLNTDFGRGGRDFGRETLLRSKNRTELLTPPVVLRFLCS